MKIGIITMHKVLNFGSSLQAYALQEKLSELGYYSEIIDYVFPPKRSKRASLRSIVNNMLIFIRALMLGFPRKKMQKKFEIFSFKHFKLSSQTFDSNTIYSCPPKYDVYMTGSDQVWNPRFIGKDTNFLLSFAFQDKTKVSYASSFATSTIPYEFREVYSKYLSEYYVISVREPSGVKIVEDLCGKKAVVCCDPVFLLNREQWDIIANDSKHEEKDKYILVYALNYMFDPYPELLTIIDYVQTVLGYKVIYLNGRKEDAFRSKSSVYKSGGPAEFVKLIKDSEIVITTSFHGAAFSLLYDKPLMAIVRNNDIEDGRVISILQQTKGERCIFPYTSECNLTRDELYQLKVDHNELDKYINNSIEFLQTTLKNIEVRN